METKAQEEFIKAIQSKNKEKFDALREEHGYLLMTDSWGFSIQTPLHHAARFGWMYAAMVLVIYDPEMGEAKDNKGQMPFDVAQENGYPKLAESLLPFAFPTVFGYEGPTNEFEPM